MEVTQYIGARYVPMLADPVEWSSANAYEPLTIVLYQGNSYTSRQAVPAGVAITNEDFWACTGNYNAQIEAYRQEVARIAGQLDDIEDDVSDAKTAAQNALAYLGTGWSDVDTVRAAINALNQAIGTLPAGVTDIGSALGDIDNSIGAINDDVDALETTLTGFDAEHPVKEYVDNAIQSVGNVAVFIGDSFLSTVYVSDANLCYHPIADALNCTPYCYAERGAGFARTGEHGNTFATLLATAANDSAFDNDDVAWCFVYGGLNDIDHDTVPGAITNNFPAWCKSARTAFPHARIVILGINAWASGYSLGTASNRGQIYYERLMKQQVTALGAGITFISMCNALGFNSNWYSSANNHPNENGHKVLASWVLSCLFGSGMMHTRTGDLRDKDNTDVGNFALYLGPGYCDYAFQSVRASIDTSTNDGYMIDEVNFIKEGSTSFSGEISTTEYQGSALYGYLGAKDEDYYLHHINYGWSRGSVRW